MEQPPQKAGLQALKERGGTPLNLVSQMSAGAPQGKAECGEGDPCTQLSHCDQHRTVDK